MLDRLKVLLNNSEEGTQREECPNCWGKQEYKGQQRQILKDQQIDVNNQRSKYSFVQKFVVERITGIKLKKKVVNNNNQVLRG